MIQGDFHSVIGAKTKGFSDSQFCLGVKTLHHATGKLSSGFRKSGHDGRGSSSGVPGKISDPSEPPGIIILGPDFSLVSPRGRENDTVGHGELEFSVSVVPPAWLGCHPGG